MWVIHSFIEKNLLKRVRPVHSFIENPLTTDMICNTNILDMYFWSTLHHLRHGISALERCDKLGLNIAGDNEGSSPHGLDGLINPVY